MAKTKRKHLAALGAKKKQRPLAHHDVKSGSMVEEKGHPRQPEITSPSCHQQKHPVKHEREGDPTAEVSHPSVSPHKTEHNKSEQNEVPVPPSSPYLQLHADDSDTNSWVDVRKQRIIIIIPPLPPAKPQFLKTSQQVVNLRKDGFRYTQRKSRATLHEDKSKGKVSNTGMYHNSTRHDAVGTLETENNTKRRRMRESICTGAPPISSMDILLASALDTDHTICTPWKDKTRQHAAAYSQEGASLDTADSSVQPRRSSLKGRKGLKAPVTKNQVAKGHIKKRKISLCKSVHPNMTRKRKKPQQATCLANDALGHLLSPDIMDVKAKGLKHCGGDFPVLSSNEAIKILTLKKHLEKAGGLRNWLCSVGLGQFKEAFEKRMWSERDLLQLQMDDLKRMGEFAVGPRRKLIWAINHLSHQLV